MATRKVAGCSPGNPIAAASRGGPDVEAAGPIRVGISMCLLGKKVRFDGGHKHDRYLTDTLGGSGLLPLVVPLTLVYHYVRVLDVTYLKDQVYLTPHPKELALRNHV